MHFPFIINEQQYKYTTNVSYMQRKNKKNTFYYIYFCYMTNTKQTDKEELKVLLKRDDLPNNVRKSIEKKLEYVNKPVCKK